MRVPWPADFPKVIVNAAWEGAEHILPDHPAYWPAKKRRNVAAAFRLCDDVVTEPNLDSLYDLAYGFEPIVVAPALTLHETQNALARSYAVWLSGKMKWELDEKIYQAKTINRDFNNNGWFRIVNEPAFYGEVEPGRPYIIADDVCAMGGTLASLRGYIETSGGQVLGMTVLASGSGKNVQISLVGDTFTRLTSCSWSNELGSSCYTEFGHGLESITEPEGRFLLRCPSYEHFRAGVDGARHG